ncbi:MAG: hypothetical protein QXM08_00385 [Thermofilaceae archaeon]
MVREELELEALKAFINYRRKRKQYFDEYSKVASDLTIARKGNILVVHDKDDFESYVYIVATKTPEKAKRLAEFIKKMREVFDPVNVSEILGRAVGESEYEFQDDENAYVFYYE